MRIKNFNQAEKYLNFLLNNSKQSFQGEKGIVKMRYFLSLIDNPQNKLRIIHIAGTSGKGSTCYLISRLLSVHNFKVGLSLSPHLIDIRERFQLNNKKIKKEEFVFYLNKILPFFEMMKKTQYQGLSFFESVTALAFYIFKEKKVDYAVIETGLGGLYDATNVIDNKDKVSVITKIGFDHMKILGDSLEEIAFQKAMIINKNSQALSIEQNEKAKRILIEVARQKNADLRFVKPFDKEISFYCDYQKENASLALETLKLISQRDKFRIDLKLVDKVFKNYHFLGRFDMRKFNDKKIILDGAHNPQKMEAFIFSLTKKFPKRKFYFLVSFKKNKQYKEMLNYIIPFALKITVTSFFDDQNLNYLSEDTENIREFLNQKNFDNYQIIKNTQEAFIRSLKETENLLVITGSFYLLRKIYKLMKIN